MDYRRVDTVQKSLNSREFAANPCDPRFWRELINYGEFSLRSPGCVYKRKIRDCIKDYAQSRGAGKSLYQIISNNFISSEISSSEYDNNYYNIIIINNLILLE